jgi:hypothetical protein
MRKVLTALALLGLVTTGSGCTVMDTLHEGVDALHESNARLARVEPTLTTIAGAVTPMGPRLEELSSRVDVMSDATPRVVKEIEALQEPLAKVAALNDNLASVGALGAHLERIARFERPLQTLGSVAENGSRFVGTALGLWMLATAIAVAIGIRLARGVRNLPNRTSPPPSGRAPELPSASPDERGPRRAATRLHLREAPEEGTWLRARAVGGGRSVWGSRPRQRSSGPWSRSRQRSRRASSSAR